MSLFDRLFKEEVITEDGKTFLVPITQALKKLFSTNSVKEMSITELQLFGKAIVHMTEDIIAEKIQAKIEMSRNFDTMTDTQFEAYLSVKYGDNWRFVTLTPEELKRVPTISTEDLKDALEKDGEAIRKASLNRYR
jgi:hypothetical protein